MICVRVAGAGEREGSGQGLEPGGEAAAGGH